MSVAEQQKPRKGGKAIFALLAILTLAGGGYAGWTMSPFRGTETEETAHPEPEQVAEERGVGNFLINFGNGEDLLTISVYVTPKPGDAPGNMEMRDSVGKIILGLAEMPVVSGQGFDAERFRKAAILIAEQEAPWIADIRIAPPGEIQEAAPEEAAEEKGGH